MNFDGCAFLSSARQLATIPPNGTPLDLEAANLRSAISRAYYAAFWRARAQYLLDGEYISRMDAHQTLINAFRNSRYRNRMAIGAHLIRLRAERNDADYESNVVLAALDHLDT
jgi:uncharacterized protein (UPF0332 family)